MFTIRLSKSLYHYGHNGRDSVSNHQPHDCLLNRLFRRRSNKTSKLRVTGLCAGNSPGTGEFPAQMASNAENVSIWWRLHDLDVHVWTCWAFPGPLTHMYHFDLISTVLRRICYFITISSLIFIKWYDTIPKTKYPYSLFIYTGTLNPSLVLVSMKCIIRCLKSITVVRS